MQVEKHCPRVKSAYADSWHVRYSTASPRQGMPGGKALVDKCQTSPCCTAQEFGDSGWTCKGVGSGTTPSANIPLEHSFDAQSGIEMAGSRDAVMEAWLHDTQYRSGHETGNFGGNKNQDTRILWENEIWRSAYALGNGVDALQAPKYAGLNILPQAGGLDDPPGQFAFGDCYLQSKQHMLQRSSFCVGDRGCVVEAALLLGEPCELQLATIDTILIAVQNAEFELDDDTLCKLVAVLTTVSPLPQFEYLIEAQVHSSIMQLSLHVIDYIITCDLYCMHVALLCSAYAMIKVIDLYRCLHVSCKPTTYFGLSKNDHCCRPNKYNKV